MIKYFLQQSAYHADSLRGSMLGGGIVDRLIPLILGFLLVAFVIAIALYVWSSIVFMNLAKKTKVASPGIAWIPLVGPALIASKIAKMPWWPILFLVGMIVPFIGGVFTLAFTIFFIIWMWKVFEYFQKPGPFALFMIIPGLGLIAVLILLSIIIWSKK